MAQDTEDTNNRTTRSVRNLGAAAENVAGVFGSLFTGAPKDIHSTLEGFSKLNPVLGVAHKAIKGFESYVGVLQSLSSTGIHFNNQIDEMILQAGAARMQIGDLARVAGESSESLAQLGAGSNNGMQRFLARQGNFYDDISSGLEERLKRLGMTVDDINDRFLQYDLIQTVSNVTQRTTDAERNRRATEFAESLDRLSKLTGKQSDELAKAVEQTAREGRVFAAQQLLPEGVRTQFVAELESYNQMYGPAMGNFMKDMVTQGFPSPNDPAMLAINSFAPQLAGHFERYNKEMRAGNTQQAQVHLERAKVEAERLRTDRNFLSQVLYSEAGASEYASAMGQISRELNSSVAVSRSAIEQSIRNDPNFAGGPITDDMIAAERQKRIDEAQLNQQRNADEGSAKVYQGYLANLTELQRIGVKAQQVVVETSFKLIQDAVGDLANKISSLNVTKMIEDSRTSIENAVGNIDSGQGGGGTVQSNLAGIVQQLAQSQLEYTTGSQTQRQLDTLARNIQNIATEFEQSGRADMTSANRDLVNSYLDQATALLRNGSNPDASARSSPAVVSAILDYLERRSFNAGTMGAGKLFRDFGGQTIAALHGLEAVTTPEQMASIVKSSSAGTMESLVEQFNAGNFTQAAQVLTPVMDTLARNNISTLNGMLNTVRTQISTANNTQTVDIDLTKLEDAIMKLPSQFKKPMEEALTSSMRPAIEQVAQNTSKSADYNERTFKNTQGMSGDYMRGA